MSTAIQKQQFRNESGGFLGVVVIGPKGETGVGVPPDGMVWLSEEEQILTANAPRRPEDNPFTEQVRVNIDPVSGEATNEKYTPLVPVNADRFVPAQGRFVPGLTSDAAASAEAQLAATGDTPVVVETDQPSAEQRHAEIAAIGADAQPGQPAPPPVPPRAAAAAAAPPLAPLVDDADPVAREQGAQPPAAPEPTPEQPPAPTEAQEPPQTPQEAPVQTEETAAVVDPAVGEETGAAAPPTGDAPEGEYQAGEEVGTPVPPSAPPAPFTPSE